jgi:DNA repair protein RadC
MTASNTNFSMIPEFHVELVRDRDIKYQKIVPGNKWTAQDAANILHTMLDHSPVEQMVVLYIDLQGYIAGAERVGLGDLGSVGVSMRNLFRGAVVAGVPSVLIAHNHIVDDVTPSKEDIMFTVAAIQASGALNLDVLDHIVVCPFGKHYSFRDNQREIDKRVDHLALDQHLADLLNEAHRMVKPLLNKKKSPADFSVDYLLGTLKNRG